MQFLLSPRGRCLNGEGIDIRVRLWKNGGDIRFPWGGGGGGGGGGFLVPFRPPPPPPPSTSRAFRAPRAPEIPISFDPFERLPRRLSLFDYHEVKIVLDTRQSRAEKIWDYPAFNFLMFGKLLMV